MSKERKTYHIKTSTIETIQEIENETGLKKSTILDKAISDFKKKTDRQKENE
jgi:hypothetical protein